MFADLATMRRLARKTPPAAPVVTLDQVRALLRKGDAKSAVAKSADLLKASPKDIEVLWLRAAALAATGDSFESARLRTRAGELQAEQIMIAAGVDMPRLRSDSAYAIAVGRNFYNRWNMGAASLAMTYGANDPARRLEAQFVLAQAQHYMGRVADSETTFRAMMAAKPEEALHGYLLYALFFRNDGGRAHAEEVREWSKRWVDTLPPKPPVFHVERRSDRPLRIGYLTPTYSNQLRHFLMPVLERHDQSRFEITMYVDVAEKELQVPGIKVKSIRDQVHRATADMIRADKIDILVDLHGHFRLGRPTTVAQKPAPVQVSWMDYTHSVGLEAMDYVLHGDHMDVPGTQELFVEQIWNIGPVLVPFRPTLGARISPAPCAETGHITFGSFNHPAKLGDPTVAAWARILKARPQARLVLKYSVFDDPILQAETRARFAAHGADPDQLLFRGHSTGDAYERAFDEIDVALDPSPVTGGTTTMEALSRSIPVLSLKGDDFYARVGMHTLMAIDMPELLAETWDDYVALACALADDLPRVQSLRETTREALDASPYRDEEGFTRRLEDAYSQMLDRWLASPDAEATRPTEDSEPAQPNPFALARDAIIAGAPDLSVQMLDVLALQAPTNPEVHYWRASALMAAGRAEAATAALDDARTFHTVAVLRDMGIDVQRIRKDPGYAKAAGLELYRHKQVALAGMAFGCAVSPEALTEQGLLNLGLAFQHQGRAEEAANVFRAAADVFESSAAFQFLLYSLFFVENGVQRYADEARAWAQRFTGDIQPLPANFTNPRKADRRLKIGFVAPSFTRSQLRQFILPVVEAHDPGAVELFFYTADAAAEVMSDLAMGTVRSIGRMKDDAAAQFIRTDQIDILVDLWGFTAGGRLGVFAYKPAPIQASWINLVQTTGLPAMDYVLHADTMDAPGTEALFTEQILRVGPVTVPYQPSPDRLAPTPTPALALGQITFGSFNNPARISDATIANWSRILNGRPSSRLLLKYGYYADPVLRRVMQAKFAGHGVDPSRIVFAGHSTGADYFASFGTVDLALDPSPCPGGTTTCDSLANGVPVLTLRGDDFYARIGVHALHAFPELVAESWDDYVARALALTADLQALDGLRAEVRPRFEASAVCDAVGFTRRLEGVWRDAFQAWADRR
ncbi:MAG: hypothetical protein BGN86_16765 [Caulobacterales bacterium 68-7]|mgnify:CR=1 FL=1|nr:MAG: hypothetical protein BGN86_16765 [Caulobacterales bacterium 68-7]